MSRKILVATIILCTALILAVCNSGTDIGTSSTPVTTTTTTPTTTTTTTPNHSPAPVKACFEMDPPSGEIAVGEQITLDARCSTPNNVNYRWDLGDGRFRTGPFIQPVFDTPGSYGVRLTVESPSGESDVVVKEVVVKQRLAANPGGPYHIESDRALTFSGLKSTTPDPPMVSYVWNFGDGSQEVDHPTPTHTYVGTYGLVDAEINYTVTLTVTDSAGHSDTARTTVTVTYVY